MTPKSPCLRHCGAAHGSLSVAPRPSWPTWRTLPRSQVPSGPQPLGVSVPRVTVGFGNRIHQETSSPLQSTRSGSKGRGPIIPQVGASPESSALTRGCLVSRDKISSTLRLDFHVAMGRKKGSTGDAEAAPTPKALWAEWRPVRPGTQAPRRRHHRRQGQPRPGQHSAAATAAHAIFSWGSEAGLAWGYRHLPSCCPLEDLGALHTATGAERKIRAPCGRRGWEGAVGAVFFLFRISTSLRSFRVGASARGSKPPLAAPSPPSSPPLRVQRAGASARAWPPARSPGGDDWRPERGAALPTRSPGSAGVPLPGAKLGDRAHCKETPVASGGTPNTIHTALMRL